MNSPALSSRRQKRRQQQNIYLDAASTQFCSQENLKGWFRDEALEEFLRNPDCVIKVVQHEDAYNEARYAAIESIRFFKDELRDYGWTWNDIRDNVPVFLVQGDSLHSIITRFINEIDRTIAPNWKSMCHVAQHFRIDDVLSILDSLPSLMSPCNGTGISVKHHLCIITGLDRVYNQASHDYVKRFLRLVEKLFITDRKGKVLLFCKTPFDVDAILSDAPPSK
ncbi:hypothetical protein M426DRAFT_27473 [Hypoxylon sp. CI-4A]|nr:hypothetical protein M426DRAFT_27473 [Hypoxylon sp. CI-4A]